MTTDWQIVLNILYIFIFMLIAKLIKEKTGLFKSIIIPTALLAGFIGLILGPEILKLADFDTTIFSPMVTHFMGIGFIALTLANSSEKQGKDSVNSGLFIVAVYCFQGIIGMLTVVGLMFTILPKLMPGLGLMLPLAYGQGPGFASSIGSSWDDVLPYGFVNQYGLTLSTIGFLVGGLIGIILINYYVRKYKMDVPRLNQLSGVSHKNLRIQTIKEINFFDSLTVQIVWIATVYFTTYFIMKLTITGLLYLGPIGQTIASLVRGFNFLFGILVALCLKQFFMFLNRRGHRTLELVDSYLMQNIAFLSFNLMITASVMAISIEAIASYWQLLLATSLSGAIFTWLFIVWLGKKVFKFSPNHYILAMYGMLTGTASTGLALLRGIDPELETDVAQNLVLGSAIATPLGLPMMALLAFPLVGYTSTNPWNYYIGTLLGLFLYLIFIVTLLLIKNKIKD